ncbi:hypothetical protein RRF57_009810 [Xylaria bambusicola]|uniref:NodB homology domain-containing protein n=1 Tax=Xylaria bambusicola TaxID=326684 RepID=A0AAN7UW88_9PEZI
MLLLSIFGGVTVALLAHGASSISVPGKRQIPRDECETNLLIDDFKTWQNGTNALRGATSDDATMNSTSISGGVLTFVPRDKDTSYIYEQWDCLNADDLGYVNISFTIKGPAAASVSLELQTKRTAAPPPMRAPTTLLGVVQLLSRPDRHRQRMEAAEYPAGVFLHRRRRRRRREEDGPWRVDKRNEEKQALALRAAADIAETNQARAAGDAACSTALIDDWASQSRLTFLYYNAMLKPTSDDGTMKSVVVANNKVTLTPTDKNSYFYSQFGCFDARSYGGISVRINAASGTTFDVQLSSSKSSSSCNGDSTTDVVVSSKNLGWTFNGKEQLYTIPFSKFSGIDLSKFTMIILSDFNKAVTMGPMAMYCGNTAAEYVAPAIQQPTEPTGTVSAPTSTATAFVIDNFASKETNALGNWHGTEDEGLTVTYSRNKMTLQTNDADLGWVTQISNTCRDMRGFDKSYLHIAYSGSNQFTVAMQQHNSACNNDAMPYPETWDSLEAARYATPSDIYIPINHFNIDRSRVIGFALKGFYTSTATTISQIEVVSSVPSGFKVPVKLPSGTFVFACKRPNSFAFAIDDGDPAYAQKVMKIIDDAGFKATFFTVGAPLLDPSTNLSAVYREMQRKGHQIALHSYTHPGLEGLADEASIDWEYTNDLKAVSQVFGSPGRTRGARMRQRYAALVPDPYIVQWSVDVEDWLWAETNTPEKQLDAFKRDVAAGGSITVMHYLYNSTVSYLPQFIQIAKATGKQLMRVDQCMMDPNAPPL